MTLAEYLRRRGVGAKSELARKTGLAYTTIHYVARGKHPPSHGGGKWRVSSETAKKIEKATKGEVTAAELLGVAS